MKRYLDIYEGKDATMLGKRMRNYGGAWGSALGARYGRFGSVAGGVLGRGLGAGLSRITGQGDYTMTNDLVHGVNAGASFGDGAVRIRHREYLGDILAATAFDIQTFELNPGLSASFPWLSQIAANYESYRFNGLVFEYNSSSGDALNSTNTALGMLLMCNQCNPDAPPFTSKQQMEVYEGCVSAKPSRDAVLGVECVAGSTPLEKRYIRHAAVPAGSDERFYDVGEFNVAVVGCQGSGFPIGELWVSYDITLMQPVLPDILSLSYNYNHFNSTTAVDSTNPFGTAINHISLYPSLKFSNPVGATLHFYPVKTSFFTVAALAGVYELIYVCVGSNTAITQPTITFDATVAAAKPTFNNAAISRLNASGTTTTLFFVQYFTYTPGVGSVDDSVLVLSGGTYPASATRMDVFVNYLGPDYA